MTNEEQTGQTQAEIDAAAAAAATAQAESEAADRAIAAQAAADKANLNNTADGVLDDGHSSVPIKGDPFANRKLLYKKASDLREAALAAEAEAEGDVSHLQRAMQEAASKGTGNELDRTSDFDTNATRAQRQETAPAAVGEQQLNEEPQVVDTRPAMTKVNVLGQEFEVPTRDIEADGGLAAYQKNRAADERLRQAAKREKELREEAERIEAERKALEQQRATAGAASTAAPSSTQTGDGGTGDVADKAQKITDALYSGDRNATKAAIQEILARPGNEKIDAAELARQAAALAKSELAAAAPAPTPEAKPAAPDPEIEGLNAYMAENFRDVITDDALRNAALAEFNRLKALPENAHRRLIDIGRDAGEFARKPASTAPAATAPASPAAPAHPRQAVIDRKQTLPPTVSGSQAHTPVATEAPTGSSHVARMRQQRGLPT